MTLPEKKDRDEDSGNFRHSKSTWIELTAGAWSGLCARMVVAPLDVLKIRVQMEPEAQRSRGERISPRSTRSILRDILVKEGPAALWQGNIPALIMVVPFAAIQFAVVAKVQPVLSHSGLPDPIPVMIASATAGAVAVGCTYPMDLLRTRMAAVQRNSVSFSERLSMVKVLFSLMSDHPRRLYSGVSVALTETVPYAVLGFTCFEFVQKQILAFSGRSELGPAEGFGAGAVAGICVKLVLLPLDNLKLRLQLGPDFFTANPATSVNSRVENGSKLNSGYFVKSSSLKLFKEVWKIEGIRGFYRGALATMLKAVPNSGIHFGVYHLTRKFLNDVSFSG
uniref:Uncharacterized protein n=1 Tax=Timspurckia oligopyrenoides TaxID=708627 RepID=A0A7S1ETX3_9RHOD|mmetsp:Transcript_6997/g.12537  ORF Transcript_6997/g.12537 Transcript_6997/m.12537 type:complete len:337 (+) Transcript_6997:155-1165(+)